MSDEPLQPAGEPGFWTLDRIANALGGGPAGAHASASRTNGSAASMPRGQRALRAIATDSRTVGTGDVFIALSGDRFDGHDFLRAAVAKGATAVVVSHPERTVGLGVPVFTVQDPTAALGVLARYRRRAWGQPVIAVAGSNGKTSTKEMLKGALGAVLAVHATTGNYNNQVGVPLTLLAIPDSADVAVVEIGTNAPGEVATLRAIAEPDIAVVTSIGEEHLEGFGDLAGVLAEEASIFDGVDLAVVPDTDAALVTVARARARQVITAGLDGGDLRATSWHVTATGQGELVVDGVAVTVPLLGVHNMRNTMLALAVARGCGISLERAAAGIAATVAPPMRAVWTPMGRAVLINDAYNSNPASARAALDLLDALGDKGAEEAGARVPAAKSGVGRQRVVVLGTMRELGPGAGQLHAEVARRALESSADLIAAIGDFGPALRDEGPTDARVLTAPDVDELWARLRPRLSADAVILLKASRGVRLERLVPLLTEWAGTSAADAVGGGRAG
jgi:UDP-N-acetylmuramoyl-tripeptide--D-alanyl-D-alanine ligase